MKVTAMVVLNVLILSTVAYGQASNGEERGQPVQNPTYDFTAALADAQEDYNRCLDMAQLFKREPFQRRHWADSKKDRWKISEDEAEQINKYLDESWEIVCPLANERVHFNFNNTTRTLEMCTTAKKEITHNFDKIAEMHIDIKPRIIAEREISKLRELRAFMCEELDKLRAASYVDKGLHQQQ